MTIIYEDAEEYLRMSTNNSTHLDESQQEEFGLIFDTAYDTLKNGSQVEVDDFFDKDFMYDQNFHRNPTVLPQIIQNHQVALNSRSLFLDISSEDETRSRLSRICRSDPIVEADQYEGYLEKQSPKLLVGWQNRYFMLKNRKLYYYKSKTKTDQVKGVINFDQVECQIKHNPQKRRFKLMKNIEKSQGHVLKLKIDEKISPLKSWRADIGDILLFRGNNFGSKITRGFTQSKFDHVGMILKFDQEKDEVFFLDATSTMGVQVTRWSRFRLFKNQVYKSLVYRHLYCERDESFLLALEQFIRTVVGNQFKLNLKKLLFTRKTVKSQSSTEQVKQLENRMFFCSELITKAYKEIGLLNTERASCRFFPHDFSKEGKIAQLEMDAKLGEEMIIEFDEDEILREYDLFKSDKLPRKTIQ
eukprot:403353158